MSRGGITPHTSAGPKKGRPPNPPSPVQSTTKPQRNDQEELWECICSLGKKIRTDFKKSGKIQSSVRELDKDIQESKLICEKIHSTGKDLGIDVLDDKKHDVNSSKETITCLLAENRKLSNTLNKLNKEIETLDMQEKDASQDQHKKNTKLKKKEDKDKKKNNTSKDSDKQHSDLSDESPFTVFKAFDRHVPRMIEILNNESLLREQKSYLDKIRDIAVGLCKQEDLKNQTVLSVKDTDKAVEIIQKELEKYFQMEEQIEKEKNEKDKLLNHVLNTTNKATSYVRNSTENIKMEGKRFDVEAFAELSSFNDDIIELVTHVESLKTKYDKNLQEISQTQNQLQETKNECETLQHRLSKMAGARLTDGNPNITNLGDPNRPMKIGETYSELYDNEWTDTMDLCIQKLGKSCGEDIIIQHLFKTIVVIKQAIDIRKMAAESTSDQLLESIRKSKKEITATYFKTMDKKILEMIMSTSFFNKCFKLCWKMVVQDPPMFLDEGPQKDKAFDKNVFREYTSSGTKVVFTVWPALYLHKNGALLVKGVVKVK